MLDNKLNFCDTCIVMFFWITLGIFTIRYINGDYTNACNPPKEKIIEETCTKE